jgi:hypothetical protein
LLRVAAVWVRRHAAGGGDGVVVGRKTGRRGALVEGVEDRAEVVVDAGEVLEIVVGGIAGGVADGYLVVEEVVFEIGNVPREPALRDAHEDLRGRGGSDGLRSSVRGHGERRVLLLQEGREGVGARGRLRRKPIFLFLAGRVRDEVMLLVAEGGLGVDGMGGVG